MQDTDEKQQDALNALKERKRRESKRRQERKRAQDGVTSPQWKKGKLGYSWFYPYQIRKANNKTLNRCTYNQDNRTASIYFALYTDIEEIDEITTNRKQKKQLSSLLEGTPYIFTGDFCYSMHNSKPLMIYNLVFKAPQTPSISLLLDIQSVFKDVYASNASGINVGKQREYHRYLNNQREYRRLHKDYS